MERNREYWATFDYGKMARDSAKERDRIQEMLRLRRETGPASPEDDMVWRQENSMLYTMYLEQRCNYQTFARRAGTRGQAV